MADFLLTSKSHALTTVFPKKYKTIWGFVFGSPLFLIDVLVVIPSTVWMVINRAHYQYGFRSTAVVVGVVFGWSSWVD